MGKNTLRHILLKKVIKYIESDSKDEPKKKEKNVIIINNGKTDDKPIIKKGPFGVFC